MLTTSAILLLLAQFTCVLANVEKLIFIPQALPAREGSGEGQYYLPPLRLTPTTPRLSAILNTSFAVPSDIATREQGVESWVILDQLQVGTRYEVRICWAATSPADFTLELYDQSEDLSRSGISQHPTGDAHLIDPGRSSVLYLRILARADYYTLEKQRMLRPDPVHIELILDPFIFNIFPKSLLHLGAVLIGVALTAWWTSFRIYGWLSVVAIDTSKKNN